MADLTLTPTAPVGGLPVRHGAMTLSLADPGPVFSVAPFRGQEEAVSSALQAAIGSGLTPVGQVVQAGAVSVLWFGRDLWLVTGAEVPALPGAAVTDQTDGWIALDLTGPRGAEVMARLVPVDLRDAAVPEGTVVRTVMHEMSVAVIRTGPEVLRIMAFRSMAKTLVHAVSEAMERVAVL